MHKSDISKIRDTIVLVDDEETVLTLSSRLFEGIYETVTFSSSDEFIKNLTTLNPSLFILDRVMPGASGLDLCRRIREIPRFNLVPVIIYSGVEPSEENIILSLEAGALTFMAKPASPGFLMAQVKALVAGYHASLNFMKQRETILSTVKHDMANYLTGVVSGVEMMKLKSGFFDSPDNEEAEIVLTCAKKLKSITEDLSFLLMPPNELKQRLSVTENSPLPIIRSAVAFAAAIGIKLTPGPGSTADIVWCDSKIISRSIFYLARFVDLILDSSEPEISVSSRNHGDFVEMVLSISGSFGEIMRGHFESTAKTILDDYSKKSVLPTFYIETALGFHDTRIHIDESDQMTHLSFQLKRVKSQAAGPDNSSSATIAGPI